MATNDLNAVTLIGTVSSIPQLKTTQNNQTLLLFRVSVQKPYRSRDGQMQVSKTTLNVSLWGQRAQALSQVIRENSRVMVIGEIKNRSWDQDGETRWSTEISAQQIFSLDQGVVTNQQPVQPQSVQPQSVQFQSPQPVPQGDNDFPF